MEDGAFRVIHLDNNEGQGGDGEVVGCTIVDLKGRMKEKQYNEKNRLHG